MRAPLIVLSVCLLAVLHPLPAAAQPGSRSAAAEALFREGRRLMDLHQYAEACPKLAESQELDPAAGTLLNLGDCYEKTGRMASSWGAFNEASRSAQARNRADWEKIGRERAAAIEPHVSRLTLTVPAGVDMPELRLSRDGVPVGRPEWGVAIPVDAGRHKIEASAPGFTAAVIIVEVPTDGKRAEAVVPKLVAAPITASPAVPPRAQPPTATAAPPKRPSSAQRTAGLVVGLVGAGGVVVGGITGVLAITKHQDAVQACTSYPNHCPNGAADGPNKQSASMASASTVSFILGGALVAVGGVLYFTAPTGSGTSVGLGTHGSDLVLHGTF